MAGASKSLLNIINKQFIVNIFYYLCININS